SRHGSRATRSSSSHSPITTTTTGLRSGAPVRPPSGTPSWPRTPSGTSFRPTWGTVAGWGPGSTCRWTGTSWRRSSPRPSGWWLLAACEPSWRPGASIGPLRCAVALGGPDEVLRHVVGPAALPEEVGPVRLLHRPGLHRPAVGAQHDDAARAGQGPLDLAPRDHDAPQRVPDHHPLGGGRKRGMQRKAPSPDGEHGSESGEVRAVVPPKVGARGDTAEDEHASGGPGGPVRPPDPLPVAPLAHLHSEQRPLDGRSLLLQPGHGPGHGPAPVVLPESPDHRVGLGG